MHLAAQVQNLLRLDLDVGRSALRAARRLVHHDPGMRQRRPLALGSGRQQERSHRRGHAHADRVDRRAQVLHRVVDRHPARNHAARRVDVHVDVLVGVVRLEEEQLRDDDVRHIIVDRRPEEHDPVHQQARKDVVRPLAPAGAFDNVRRIDRGVGHAVSSVTVDCWRSQAKTFSSVIECSSSPSRWFCCSEAYSLPGSTPRALGQLGDPVVDIGLRGTQVLGRSDRINNQFPLHLGLRHRLE